MPKERLNTSAFSKTDSQRIKTHLEKLLPYLQENSYAIVGGIAIRHYVAEKKHYPQRPFNDLDIIVSSPEAVSRDVSKEFLVYH